MQQHEIVKYCCDASDVDYKAMQNLFISKDYVWALFLGHLVIEKLLKGLASINNNKPIPKIHDLNKLAKFANINLDEKKQNLFDILTSFNIEARYPDYKKEFYKKCNQDFAEKYINEIKGIRSWLINQISI